MTLNEFVDLVREMRSAQRAFFQGDKSLIGDAKRLEHRVDMACKTILSPQMSLFGETADDGDGGELRLGRQPALNQRHMRVEL